MFVTADNSKMIGEIIKLEKDEHELSRDFLFLANIIGYDDEGNFLEHEGTVGYLKYDMQSIKLVNKNVYTSLSKIKHGDYESFKEEFSWYY